MKKVTFDIYKLIICLLSNLSFNCQSKISLFDHPYSIRCHFAGTSDEEANDEDGSESEEDVSETEDAADSSETEDPDNADAGMTALMMIVRLRALMTHKLMSLRKKLMKLTVLIQIVIITLQKPIALLLL